MIIYLENTINLLISSGEKEKVEELIKSGQVRETESGIKYLKVWKIILQNTVKIINGLAEIAGLIMIK